MTESTLSHTAPDASMLNADPFNRLYLDRTLVGFAAEVDRTSVESVLDDVLDDLTAWSAWEIVGAIPAANLFQVEWTYDGTASEPELADHAEVMQALTLQADITGVQAETPIQPHSNLTLPSDYDHLYDNDTDTGAMAQISLEEARRLLRFSGLAGLPGTPSMVIFDSGLYFGVSPSGGGLVEFPDDRFSLWELHGDEWATTSAPGHAYRGTVVNHSNSTSAVVGAASQSDPDWLAGTVRTATNMSGIWASFDLFGVNDDELYEATGEEETDEAGEAIDYQVMVVNDYTVAGADDLTEATSMLAMAGLACFGYAQEFAGVPFVFPQGVEAPKEYEKQPEDDPDTPDVDAGTCWSSRRAMTTRPLTRQPICRPSSTPRSCDAPTRRCWWGVPQRVATARPLTNRATRTRGF